MKKIRNAGLFFAQRFNTGTNERFNKTVDLKDRNENSLPGAIERNSLHRIWHLPLPHSWHSHQSNGKSQSSTLFLSTLIVISLSLLCCSKEKPTEHRVDCWGKLQGFHPSSFDSLHIKFNYRNDAFSNTPFLSLSQTNERNYLKGKIENIEETEFKLETRFDEEVEIPTRKTIYIFDNKSNLIKRETGLDKKETTTYEYDNRNYLTKEIIDSQTKKTTTFNYNNLGLLKESKCDDTFFQEHKLKYDSSKLRTQEILINYDRWNFKDSVVIKYSYFREKLNEIIFYNKEGERINYSFVYYKENEIGITTQRRGLFGRPDENISQISLTLDSACRPQLITQVYKWVNDENVYVKIELNDLGDMISYIEYKRKISPNEDLEFIDIDKHTDLSKFETMELIRYEYKYDQLGNWIERKGWQSTSRRIIKYISS